MCQLDTKKKRSQERRSFNSGGRATATQTYPLATGFVRRVLEKFGGSQIKGFFFFFWFSLVFIFFVWFLFFFLFNKAIKFQVERSAKLCVSRQSKVRQDTFVRMQQ